MIVSIGELGKWMTGGTISTFHPDVPALVGGMACAIVTAIVVQFSKVQHQKAFASTWIVCAVVADIAIAVVLVTHLVSLAFCVDNRYPFHDTTNRVGVVLDLRPRTIESPQSSGVRCFPLSDSRMLLFSKLCFSDCFYGCRHGDLGYGELDSVPFKCLCCPSYSFTKCLSSPSADIQPIYYLQLHSRKAVYKLAARFVRCDLKNTFRDTDAWPDRLNSRKGSRYSDDNGETPNANSVHPAGWPRRADVLDLKSVSPRHGGVNVSVSVSRSVDQEMGSPSMKDKSFIPTSVELAEFVDIEKNEAI
jgi:hypothetical protein